VVSCDPDACNDGKVAAIPERLERRHARVQAEEAVEIDGTLGRARPRDGN